MRTRDYGDRHLCDEFYLATGILPRNQPPIRAFAPEA